MAFKRLVAAASALALVFSPTVAAASTAAATSKAAAQEVAPADETAEGSELRRTGIIIPLAGVILLILIILYATKKGDKEPISP